MFLIYGFIMLLSLELLLRLAGFQVYKTNVFKNAQALIAEDEVLGWKLLPGSYEVGSLNDAGDQMILTIDSTGGRVTGGISNAGTSEQILLIGGSFTMGYGVDDQETFAWQLNEQFNDIYIKNMGVGGYGAYQSLLVLEKQLQNNENPKCVIYGMIDHHRLRDVAQSSWLEILHYQKSRKVKPKVPYVTLERDSVVNRHNPTSVRILPFSNYLVTSLMTQRTYNKILSMRRVSQSKALFKLLIEEMSKLCRENKIVFYVNIMSFPDEEVSEMKRFFDQKQIKYIDSNIELTESNTIPGDGHPNSELHKLYARKIADKLIKDGIFGSY